MSADAPFSILLVPGGGSSVHGYFTALEESLGSRVPLLAFDVPGHDAASGRQWLTLDDHARWLASELTRRRRGPVVVVGHSLGGLVALRLALDEPGLVAGLLLLDPSPPPLGCLLPKPLVASVGVVRRACGVPRRAHAAVPIPRVVPLSVRLRWYVVQGGVALAADVARGGVPAIPTVVVSAGEHTPTSVTRRAHERLVAWLPDATLEVWPGTTHAIHPEQPDRVAETVLALAARTAFKS